MLQRLNHGHLFFDLDHDPDHVLLFQMLETTVLGKLGVELQLREGVAKSQNPENTITYFESAFVILRKFYYVMVIYSYEKPKKGNPINNFDQSFTHQVGQFEFFMTILLWTFEVNVHVQEGIDL